MGRKHRPKRRAFIGLWKPSRPLETQTIMPAKSGTYYRHEWDSAPSPRVRWPDQHRFRAILHIPESQLGTSCDLPLGRTGFCSEPSGYWTGWSPNTATAAGGSNKTGAAWKNHQHSV